MFPSPKMQNGAPRLFNSFISNPYQPPGYPPPPPAPYPYPPVPNALQGPLLPQSAEATVIPYPVLIPSQPNVNAHHFPPNWNSPQRGPPKKEARKANHHAQTFKRAASYTSTSLGEVPPVPFRPKSPKRETDTLSENVSFFSALLSLKFIPAPFHSFCV